MGQKVNPNIIRLGIVKSWNSIWYFSKKEIKIYIQEDLLIRYFFKNNFPKAKISKILIERVLNIIKITIFTAIPSLIIGKNKENLDDLHNMISKITYFIPEIITKQIYNEYIDAKLIANNIALQLKNRANYRIVMKKSIFNAIKEGIKGIKIKISGRLGGAEIARKEWLKEGRIPLHTFIADIDYGTSTALTNYGLIGIKVWVFKGELLNNLESTVDNKYKEKMEKYIN